MALRWSRGPSGVYAYANDTSAFACLIRSYRSLRAASTLLLCGYYGEVRHLLRGVYESASLSRMLAKEPDLAEKWLRKQQWFPEKDVRAWLRKVRGNQPGEAKDVTEDYAIAYRQISVWAHPTAVSCMPLIKPDDDDAARPGLQLSTTFDPDTANSCILEITFAAIFACFAFRNSLVDERAIDPGWREAFYKFAQQASGTDMPQLVRNWEEERRLYRELKRKVQEVDSLDEHLRTSPSSFDNLKDSPSP